MDSCLYLGWVRHRRYRPHVHAFRYRLFMVCLRLDELDTVFAGRWLWSTRRPNLAWFRREDYLAPADQPLDQALLDLVEARLGFRPQGPIYLITHVRYFGYVFNPVSFYYCYAQDGIGLEAIVAEINNTPWDERYSYVLDARAAPASGPYRFLMDKAFHVSPFMPMQQTYDWRFSTLGEQLSVHMINLESGVPYFDATLNLQRRPLTGLSLAGVLLRHPLITVKVALAIYWQALLLKLKRTPFYPHP